MTITARKPDELAAAAKELVAGPGGRGGRPGAGRRGQRGVGRGPRGVGATRTVAAFGRLDILVNNTGVNPVYGPLVDADLDAVRKIFDDQHRGGARLTCSWRTGRGWREHGGSIVNLASVGGLRSTGVIAAYGASKAALIRLTEELAWQLGPSIRVNAVAPAVVKTKFAAALYAEGEDKVSAAYPMKRLGRPGGRGRAGRVPGVGRGVVDHRRDRAGRRRPARHRHPRLTPTPRVSISTTASPRFRHGESATSTTASLVLAR